MIAESGLLFIMLCLNVVLTLIWRTEIRRMRRELALLEDRLANGRRYLDARRAMLDEDCCKN
jgi:hypothetical protein